MYIKTTEQIYLTDEEINTWCKIDTLLDQIYTQTEDEDISKIVANAINYLSDLYEYVKED